MTQDELAAYSGIDSSNIRGYEAGRSMPSVHTLVRIATTVGTTPGYLLDGISVEMFPVTTSDARRRAG